MRSKNSKRITSAESRHMAAVKTLPCSVCGQTGPSEAHHIKQGAHFCTIPLCCHCHRGPMGLHGDKTMWRIHKPTEIGALNETLRMICSET